MDLNIISTFCLCFLLLSQVVRGTKFTLINKCGHTIWPGISANAGSLGLDSTGFELPADASRSLTAPTGWTGRFWARTGCNFDESGEGSCRTGDCGSGHVECNGAGADPPATIAGFSASSGGNGVIYGVSFIDGYNLPLIVETTGGKGACASSGCAVDLHRECPPELWVEGGEFDSPVACLPSVYPEMLKTACPRSFTCSGADYTLTFCPSHPS